MKTSRTWRARWLLTRLRTRRSGRVQGVGFRYHTAKEAKVGQHSCSRIQRASDSHTMMCLLQRLNLRGWVRNARDGSVEGQAAGSAQSLDEL